MSFFDINKFILLEDLLNEDTAYHGSPYNFDKFDTAFMGKGEGAQVHGWGLYFSLNPDTVYRRYRGRISNNKDDAYRFISYKGKNYERGGQMYSLLKLVANSGKQDAIDKITKLLQDKSYLKKHPQYSDLLDKTKNVITNMDDSDIKQIEFNAGQNYTVEIPDIKTYLVEFKKWNQQPANVKKAFTDIYAEINSKGGQFSIDKTDNGKELYNALRYALESVSNSNERSDKLASLELLKHGVPGIFYDGYTDGKCVVIFSGNDIKIVSKAHSPEEDKMDLADDDVSEFTPADVSNIKKMTQKMQMAIVKERIDLFKYINNPSEKTCLEAIKKDPSLISYVDNPTEEMQKMAIKNNPSYIFKIDNPSKDMIKYSIENNLYDIEDLFTRFKNLMDYDLAYLALKSQYGYRAFPYIFDTGGGSSYDAYRTCDFYNLVLKDKSIISSLTGRSAIRDIISIISSKMDEYKNLDTNIVNELAMNFYFNKKVEILAKIKYKNVLSLASEKTVNAIILKLPMLAKGLTLKDNMQMKLIQKNPFNIRYISNPSKQVVDKALELNPQTKDYML